MKRLREPALLVAAAAVLSLPALANGYPFIFSDTGAYLYAGMAVNMPWDRPLLYGLILRLASLGISPWLTIAFQALVTALVVDAAFRLLAGVGRHGAATLATLAVVTAATGAGINAAMIMPDGFTLIAFLCVAVILAAPALGVADALFLGTMLVLASAMHLAHVVSIVLLLAGVAIWKLVRRGGTIPWRRVVLAGGLMVASWLAVPATHALAGAGFRMPPGSPVFLVARMAGNGMLVDFLRDECPRPGWRLCDQVDEIPESSSEFIWGEGPFKQNGGPTPETFAEYGDIFRASLGRPRWLARHLGEGFVATLQQLVRFDPTSALDPYPAGSFPHRFLVEYFPDDEDAYLAASQQQGSLSLKGWLPAAQRFLLLACVLVVATLALRRPLRRSIEPPLVALLALVPASLLVNAVAGALSEPVDRYQARLMPLVPIAVALLVAAPPVRAALAREARDLFRR